MIGWEIDYEGTNYYFGGPDLPGSFDLAVLSRPVRG